jgi:hypothetical protein
MTDSQEDLRQRQFAAQLAEMTSEERESTLRTATLQTETSVERRDLSKYKPPNPYERGLQELRERYGLPSKLTVAISTDGTPPDSYQRDLDALRRLDARRVRR